MEDGLVLSAADRETYAEQGFVVVKDVLTPTEIAAYTARARSISCGDFPKEAKSRVMRDVRVAKGLIPAPEDPEMGMWKLMNPDRFDPAFRAFMQTPRLVDALSDIIGPDVIAFLLMYIYKPPGLSQAVHPYHQDAFYFPFGPHDLCAGAWLPLDDTDAENGTIQVIPGSHKNEKVLPHTLPEGVANAAMFYVPEVEEKGGGVALEVKAGDCVLFHSRTLHRTGGNSSQRNRRVITMHGASAACVMDRDVRIDEFGMTLVRGKLHEGGLTPAPAPKMEFGVHDPGSLNFAS